MSKYKDLSLWNSAVISFEQGNHGDALHDLANITEQSSKIRWNIGAIYQKMGDLDKSVRAYTATIEHDEHNALAYYQRACIHHHRNNYQSALADFIQSHTLLRGRSMIDYAQLGLRHKLYAGDILHNQGVCHLLLGDYTRGMEQLLKAKGSQTEARLKHIEGTLAKINNRTGSSTNLTLILLPSDAIFKPPADKITHMKSINYLGKSKLVTAQNEEDKFTGFSGKQLLNVVGRQNVTRSAPVSPGTRSPHNISPHSPEGANPTASEPASLVNQLHRALSPDRDQRPTVLKPQPHNHTSKTPPAKWSPTSIASAKRAAIPPPPNRSLPPPPNKPMPTPPQPIPTISVSDTARAQVKGHGRGRDQIQHVHNKHKNELSNALPKNSTTPEVPPPPPLPNRSPRASSPRLQSPMVTVVMVCTTEQEVTVPENASLAIIIDKASKTFLLNPREFDIWCKDSSGEHFMVRDNRKMQRVWDKYGSVGTLKLWVFSKS